MPNSALGIFMVLRCDNPDGCDTVLGIPDGRPRLTVVAFPEYPLGAAMLLQRDPSIHVCPDCGWENRIMDGYAVRSPDLATFLLVSEETERELLAARGGHEGLARSLQCGSAKTTTDARLFRRVFIKACLEEPATFLQLLKVQALKADVSPVVPIRDRCNEFDRAFFAAHFVLSTGAVDLGVRPIDGQLTPQSAFEQNADLNPDFSAPSTSPLLRMRAETGKVAFHFAHAILLDGIQRENIDQGATRILEALPPGLFLIDECEHAFRAELARCKELMPIGPKGGTSARYFVEAAAALAYLAVDKLNPDRSSFSRLMAFFELSRRLDESDERQLLDPGLLRRMLDRETFIGSLRQFGSARDQQEMSVEGKQRNLKTINATAWRIYPDEPSLSNGRVEMTGLTADTVGDLVRTVLQNCADSGADPLTKVPLNIGAHQLMEIALEDGGRAVLDRAVETALDFAGSLGLNDHIDIVNGLVRFLNSRGHWQTAKHIAEATYQRFRSELDDDDVTRAAESLTHFFCELGNCRRYAGAFDTALDTYRRALDLAGQEISNKNTHVLYRNIAIVLRSIGRTSEARDILAQLKTVVSNDSLPGVLLSHSMCLAAEGRHEEAAAELEANQNAIAGRSLRDSDIRQFAMMLANAAAFNQNLDDAITRFAPIIDACEKVGDNLLAGYLRARVLKLKRKRGDQITKAYLDQTIAGLYDVIVAEPDAAGVRQLRVGCIEMLADLLVSAGRSGEAEQVVDLIHPDTPVAWPLYLKSALLMARRGYAGPELYAAIAEVIEGLDTVATTISPDGDPFNLFSQYEWEMAALAALVADGYSGGIFPASLLRLVADLQASPVLSRRLRGQEDSQNVIEGVQDEAVAALLSPHRGGLLQSLMIGHNERIGLVITRIEDGQPVTELVEIPLSRKQATKLTKVLTFRINTTFSDASDLSLGNVPGWTALSRTIADAVAQRLEAGRYLAVVPGPLDALILSLALGERHPIAIGASLSVVQTLDRRRRRRDWKPSRLGDFSVWRVRDREEAVAAMRRGVDLVSRKAKDSEICIGREATGERLIGMLSGVDLLRISAHGVVNPAQNEMHLLVAADGSLPPTAVGSVRNNERNAHWLSWNTLAGLDGAAGVVVSTACSSGFVVTAAGGERLGLERVLFRAGTFSYVAPLWEVPIEAAQDLTLALIERMILSPETPVPRLLWEVRTEARRDGVSPVARAGFAAFGAMS